LPRTCGDGTKDCCAANVVPGGTFNRGGGNGHEATLSDFKLDVYEVTVGRFRAFVDAGKGTKANPPASGDGAHPKIANSGWNSTLNAGLEKDTATLKARFRQSDVYTMWTDTPGAHENRPINEVSWFAAFAFCAWDGGRLPTDAEWTYAGMGGSEQRPYAWGTQGPSADRAAYGCMGDGSPAGQCAPGDILNVGSKPAGNGKWGHADLIGNLEEWTLDSYVYEYILPCHDCAQLAPSTSRVLRGDYYNETSLHGVDFRNYLPPEVTYTNVGFRCARSAR
jgi:formylglycine-generating enzyme required for sulfatase activity